MMNDKTYYFSTFQEAMEVVPEDKLEECFRQIGLILSAAKSLYELQNEVSKAVDGLDIGIGKLTLPLSWIDDGKCSNAT